MKKHAKPLPKSLPGTVCRQFVCCGRPRCACASGDLHGPYFYRFWREDGQLRKAYVKRADVAQVRAACAEDRKSRQLFRAMRDLGSRQWQHLQSLIREYERA
jgi:hypothetical protein